MRLSLRPSLVLGFAASFATAPANAQLLVSPTGGSTITTSADDAAFSRTLSNPFSLYGSSYSSVYVSSNGMLSFGNAYSSFGDATLGGLAEFSSGPIVAPMYDDLLLPPGSVSDLNTADYYAVTYDGVGTYGLPGNRTFQAVLFTDALRIGGFDFQAGDIAFSYGALTSAVRANSATVGIAQTNSTFTPLPGTSDGTITNYALVPNTGNQFVLFRGGANGYEASIQSTTAVTATPEPATMGLLAMGLAGIAGIFRRRRTS